MKLGIRCLESDLCGGYMAMSLGNIYHLYYYFWDTTVQGNVKTYKHAGKSVTVVHDDDLTTTYHHLDTQDVTKGDIVEAGQQIGTSGNTGRSTGPHLHIEARKGGKRVDPESVPGLVEKVLTPLPARPTLSPEESVARCYPQSWLRNMITHISGWSGVR